MLVIGGGKIECCRCHLQVEELIDINHRYGDGKKDRPMRVRIGPLLTTEFEDARYRMLKGIVSGTRNKNEFDLRCKVCNVAHYVWRIWGIRYKIRWQDPLEGCERCPNCCEHDNA